MVLPTPSQTPEQGNSPTQTATMVLPSPSQTPEQGNSPTQTATMVLPSPSQTPEQGNSPTQTATMVLPSPSQTPDRAIHQHRQPPWCFPLLDRHQTGQFSNTDSHHGASHS